ncbi:helix-turn-helix domain-containing protein [Saccharopolyspora flava]|uniref:Beta-galactosidase n=1 Tax=Saccharopolyspora flava TaxID=95161 RepID=A0A1I6S8U5_9PSEU|nr:helix-turn-helix domain-containing protein [Saccharopolyspora flava]SFS73356.1 Beta-galactosidase [Saccharopolyspora flava]
MTGTRSVEALAEALRALKTRSGHSYEQIGRRAHLGRSTVHRYCSGASVPSEFGAIEHIAKACGADREELSRLYHLWVRADAARETPDADSEAREPGARRRRWPWWLPVALLCAVALVAAYAWFPTGDDRPVPARSAISAPSWTSAPIPIAPEFVGVTTNSNTGLMPSFPVGSVRLWNSSTGWHDLEPERGRYDWTVLDTLTGSARANGVPVTMTFGNTPDWAAPGSPRTPESDGSRRDPPQDMADWDRFVRAVVAHAGDRIGAYELWDIGSPPDFSGTVEQLVEMTRLGSRAIRELAPGAAVVCPGFADLWSPAGHDWMQRFSELGGFEHCDYASVKVNPRSASDPPETMIELHARIDATLHRGRGGIRLWNAGWAPEVTQQRRVEPERAADHAVRYFLASLWSDYERTYFYNWGSDRVPMVLQPLGYAPTKAGLFVGELQRWLTGAEITSCGQGERAGLPGNVWQCRFLRAGRPFVIRWTHDGTALLPPEPGTTRVRHLDGTSASPSERMPVTERPVLMEIG